MVGPKVVDTVSNHSMTIILTLKCPVKRLTQILAFSYNGSYGILRIRSHNWLTCSDEISFNFHCAIYYNAKISRLLVRSMIHGVFNRHR